MYITPAKVKQYYFTRLSKEFSQILPGGTPFFIAGMVRAYSVTLKHLPTDLLFLLILLAPAALHIHECTMATMGMAQKVGFTGYYHEPQ